MNIWTKKSIELANQKDYLDQLFKVYPMSSNLKRELPETTEENLKKAFDERDNEKLISILLKHELFPVKDSYVAYLKRDPSSIKRNPNTINRLAGMMYSMGFEDTIFNMTLPKETNRQIGPLFSNWLRNGSIGAKVTQDIGTFLNYDGNIILDATDAVMETFANQYLGYTHRKGLDFIAKFNKKFIVAEAKFLTDFGGHQNAQLADALNVMNSTFKITKHEVIPISILDGVLYIPNGGKMYNIVTTSSDEDVIISSLLLRDYLYSL